MVKLVPRSRAVKGSQLPPRQEVGALSDENRLAILLAVAQQDRSVTELTTATGLAQTLVSHHLKSLRDNGLVTVTAHGRSNVYSLCCAAVADPLEMLAALAKDPSNSLTTGA